MSILPNGEHFRQLSLFDTEQSVLISQSHSLTYIAKLFNYKPSVFNQILHRLGLIYKLDKSWVGSEKALNQRLVVHRRIAITHSDGQPDLKVQVLLTPKCKLWLKKHLLFIQ